MNLINTYTLPRPFFGYNIPIAIQSSFLKDYCHRRELIFSLPETELTTSGSYKILKKMLKSNRDILMCSIFILPLDNEKQFNSIFCSFVKKKIKLHFALESISLSIKELLIWREEYYNINQVIPSYSSFLKTNN